MNKYQSIGILHYDGNKLVLLIDKGIAKLYRSLIPKYRFSQPQAYDAHITVIRGGVEIPQNMEAWGQYEGEKVLFEYDPTIQYKEPYYYLVAHSNRLEEIREEMGLPRHRVGYTDFHITIANTKA